ncbi:MAG: hypothetical protein AAF725_23780, partial [Acidobacteriota bacterium]
MADNDEKRSRPDLSVLRRDPEELEERRGAGWVGWLVLLALIAGAGYAVWAYVPLPFLLPEVETAAVRQVT